jgi:hypothetical protein
MIYYSSDSQLGKNDVTWGQAKSTAVPPDQKSKQSLGANLFSKNIAISQLTGYALLPATNIKLLTRPAPEQVMFLSKRCTSQQL